MEEQNFRQMVRELRQLTMNDSDILQLAWDNGDFREKPIDLSTTQIICCGKYAVATAESFGGSDQYSNHEVIEEPTGAYLSLEFIQVLQNNKVVDITDNQANQIQSIIENGYN